MSGAVLLTGATGFLGREILWRLLRRPGTEVLCLVRARDEPAARARLDKVLDAAQPAPLSEEERGRARALCGDLTRERLGLEERRWQGLAASVGRIVHGAATVRFDLPEAEARRINLAGTRRVLDLAREGARRGALSRFDYIGTAYVAGDRRGLIGEEELEAGQRFHNTYEQTKAEAERAVRELRGELPIAIFRPSIIVGDSRTGYTSSFKVLYWPLKMVSRGLFFAVPARADGFVDIVPVDFVCDAMETISARAESRGRSFHLCAGPKHALTLGECVEMACSFFGVRKPIFVDPVTFYSWVRPLVYMVAWGKRRRALRAGRIYVPYVAHHARFDTSQTEEALRESGLRIPDVSTYFERLLEYAIESEWGRRPASR